MRFIRSIHFGDPLKQGGISIAVALMIAGCASAPTEVKMESRSIAKRLGFPDCRVSALLSQSDVIEDAKKVGNPNPEKNQEWIEITKSFQPGDQLRAVNCLKSSRSTYFYALIRNDEVILKFYSTIFD